MRQSRTRDLGLDGHQEAIAVAYVAHDHGAEGTSLGTMGTRPCDIDPRVRKLQSTAKPLVCVEEAGPCGSWLSRDLTHKGYQCWVVAPSLIPKQAGDRVHTARRDAVPRARLRRSGDLTPVYGPTVEEEAMRDLTRARDATIGALTAATCRLKAFLRRHDIRYTGRATWGPAHRRWLSEVVGATPAPPLVFQEYVRAVHEHTDRLPRLAHARHAPGHTWRLQPVVEALHAWRGVPCPVAVTSVAALGDLPRVDHPRPRRRDVGLPPAADARGERRRQGSITTTGNTHARRALVDGAWASRDPAKVSRHRPRRLAKRPNAGQEIRWKAHVRLGTRARKLSARGQHAHHVGVASARALSAWMWAIATEVPVRPSHAPIVLEPRSSASPRQGRGPGLVSPATA